MEGGGSKIFDDGDDDKEFIDWFDELGVEESSSDKDIEKAYRKKALIYHPDRFKSTLSKDDNEESQMKELEFAKIKFLLINKAKDVLLNPIKREKFTKKKRLLEQAKARYSELDEMQKDMKADLERRENEINLSKAFLDQMKNKAQAAKSSRENKISSIQRENEQFIYDYMRAKKTKAKSSDDDEIENDQDNEDDGVGGRRSKSQAVEITLEQFKKIEEEFIEITKHRGA